MEKYFIYMFLNGAYQKCALFKYDGSKYYLAYGKQYLERPDAIAIDPVNLPLYSRQYESESIFGALKDSSPDRWGRYLLDKKFNRGLTEMEYILANGLEHVGALGFSPEGYNGPMKLTPDGYIKHSHENISLDVIINQTEMVIKHEDDKEKLKELLTYGPSLGGARPKYSVESDGISYLAKYSVSQDTRREPLIEFASMSMAKDYGLNVPEIKIGKIIERDVFYIKRFDKEGKNKYPFISALSLCGWDENGYGDWSYPIFCNELIKIGESEAAIKKDLKELFQRIAFNIAINNNDDHPRNHGVLYRNGAWGLSPLYDAVPMDSQTQSFSLAMEIGIDRKEASKRNLLSACEYFKLSKEEGSILIEKIFKFVSENWGEYFKKAGLSDTEIERFSNAMTIKN